MMKELCLLTFDEFITIEKYIDGNKPTNVLHNRFCESEM